MSNADDHEAPRPSLSLRSTPDAPSSETPAAPDASGPAGASGAAAPNGARATTGDAVGASPAPSAPQASPSTQEQHGPRDEELRAIGDGTHSGPHSVLGQHPAGPRHVASTPASADTGASADANTGADAGADARRQPIVIRARRPFAETVTAVLASGTRVRLEHVAHGVWAGEHDEGFCDYVIEARYGEHVDVQDDPYRFIPSIGELDLYLLGEGRHEKLWDVLGAHYREHAGTNAPSVGTSFTVWAPHARAVRVAGSFNDWDGARHAMRRLNGMGIWELFVPGVEPHSTYKFQLLTNEDRWIDKADPVARHAERPPHTASVVAAPRAHEWGDGEWMRQRASSDPHAGPMSVYELHAMSWRPGAGYRELADELIPYLDELGFTHVEFMPLAEHPFGPSWGYQVTGYYAPTSRLGSPDDLRYLIDRLHQAGYGVIMDWVPGHFPKDEFALGRFDGEALYEHPDPRLGEQLDWGTYVFNFGNSQVRNFLVANALYWFDEFHIDGLRVDAVASMLYLDYSRTDWVPNRYGGRENLEAIDFLQEACATAYKLHPGIMMIAEESTSFDGVTRPTSSGGLGFGLKWNMGWMNDNLRYIAQDPIYRRYHHGELTFSFVYAWSEQYVLPISHDEVVHGKGSMFAKMPGDHWQKLANLRLFYAYQWGHPGKQLLFMGQEFGQPAEWNEGRGLDWWLMEQPPHRGVAKTIARLNELYRTAPALWELDHEPEGLQWIDGGDVDNSVLAFLRRDRSGDEIAMVFNFSNQVLADYGIGVPKAGRWVEVLNTDASEYGGSGVGNPDGVTTAARELDGFTQSLTITVPPLAAVWFRREA